MRQLLYAVVNLGCQPEIGQPNLGLGFGFIDEDVKQLNVSVDDALLVNVRNCCSELFEHVVGLGLVKMLHVHVLEVLRQVPTLHKLGHDEHMPNLFELLHDVKNILAVFT